MSKTSRALAPQKLTMERLRVLIPYLLLSYSKAINKPRAPTISVVIPAYREAKALPKTLQALNKVIEKYSGAVEVIVVDNNSDDGGATKKAAESFAGVEVVFEPKNQIARARNKGAAAATGDILFFLDADTKLAGNIFDKVEKSMSGGAIGGGVWVRPDAGLAAQMFFQYAVNVPVAFLTGGATVGPCMYCDRDAFIEVGGFDEALYVGEEFSLPPRLKKAEGQEKRNWEIIRNDGYHDAVTSSRKMQGISGIFGMAVKNSHLLLQKNRKNVDFCSFWYGKNVIR